MSEKIQKIIDKNSKNNEAQIKCHQFLEEKKEKNLNKLIEKMIHKTDVIESLFIMIFFKMIAF